MSTALPSSPSSSPRLPSPPPIAEDQTGPQSPSSFSEFSITSDRSSNLDNGASRRIRPGTKAVDMHEGPPLVDLAEIDSPFQLTEHLKALYFSYTHPKDSDNIVPITRATAAQLATAPASTDRALWLYELCRFLVQKVNIIIVALFADAPPCSAQTCPEMRASEWQYLCAVHEPPKSCCAIDYCCHTLDGAANTLTSSKYFPSRINLNEGSDSGPGSAGNQIKNMTNVLRRVYRIFAHAWFQHREVFWRVESTTGLYVFFKTVCDVYNLIPEDNYTIPPEAEGIEGGGPLTQSSGVGGEFQHSRQAPSLVFRRDGESSSDSIHHIESPVTPDANLSIPTAAAATARRHRQSPSKGSNVATVVEENEEDDQVPATAIFSNNQYPIGSSEEQEPDTSDPVQSSANLISSAASSADNSKDIPKSQALAEGRSVPVDLSNIGIMPSPKALERPSMIPRLASPSAGSSPSNDSAKRASLSKQEKEVEPSSPIKTEENNAEGISSPGSPSVTIVETKQESDESLESTNVGESDS